MEHNQEMCQMRFKNIEERLEKIECRTENYAVMEERIKTIGATVEKIDIKLNQILEKPSKRWDLVVATIITALVTGAVTFFIK